MKIKKNIAKEMIYNLRGRFFSATFIKKDGSVRHMTCRTGVAKYVKGNKPSYSYDHLVRVWDSQVQDYRFINIDTLIGLRMNGESYYVE